MDESVGGSGTFVDIESGDDAYWNVRATDVGVAIALSLTSDGDVQVVVDSETARLIGQALLTVAG